MAYPAAGGGSSPPTTYPPGGAPPPALPARPTHRRRRRSRRTLTVLLSLVVVVVIVLGLYVSGIVPGFSLKGKGGSDEVTFNEAGLPSGSNWSVTMDGVPHSASSSSAITFSEPAGTHVYTVGVTEGLVPQPANGTLTINGPSTAQTISFRALLPSESEVTFTEQGLPTGTPWSVTLEAALVASTDPSITFAKTNGSYSFGIGAEAGYAATPGSGLLTVAGAPVTQRTTYVQQGGSQGNPIAFGQARGMAQATANENGTGWVPIVAEGVATPISYANSSPPSLSPGCPYEGGFDSWPVLSPLTGDYYNGYLPAWTFEFYQNSSGSVLGVYVAGTQALIAGTVTSAACVGDRGNFTAFPSTTLDSPALATLLNENDTPWVEGHADASVTFTLVSGHSMPDRPSVGAEWTVRFTDCDTFGGGTGDNFSVVANASTGVVSSNLSASGVSCGSAPFAPGHPPGGNAGSDPAPSAPLLGRWA